METHPVMTVDHVNAMRWIVAEWPYADVRFDRWLLDDILRHLTALIAQPVPSRHTSPEMPHVAVSHDVEYDANGYPVRNAGKHYPGQNISSLPDWRREYAHLNDEDCQSDQ